MVWAEKIAYETMKFIIMALSMWKIVHSKITLCSTESFTEDNDIGST